jgi:hypothetical protein
MGIDLDNGILRSKNFAIDKDGNAWLNADFSSLGATIGGWQITEDRIWYHNEENSNGAVLYPENVGTTGEVFAIGTFDDADTWSNAGFRVDGNGKMYATGADIEGKLVTGQGSRIGPCAVDNNSLYIGTSFENAATFICSSSNTYQSIGGSGSLSHWTLKAGSNFGVNLDEGMFCNKGHIGGWDVDENGIKNSYEEVFPSLTHTYSTAIQPNNISTLWKMGNYTFETKLSGGYIHITNDYKTTGVKSTTIMRVTWDGENYDICLDTETMSLVVVAQQH